MVDDDNNKMQSLITFDRVLFASRRKLRLSQKEFVLQISDRLHQIDYSTYSKIESAQIDIRFSEWDWLIPRLSNQFQIDRLWLQSIREQTEVKPVSLNSSQTHTTYVRQPGG